MKIGKATLRRVEFVSGGGRGQGQEGQPAALPAPALVVRVVVVVVIAGRVVSGEARQTADLDKKDGDAGVSDLHGGCGCD